MRCSVWAAAACALECLSAARRTSRSGGKGEEGEEEEDGCFEVDLIGKDGNTSVPGMDWSGPMA